MRILIVDDLDFMRAIIREVLTEAGFTVCGEARDGYEGIQMFRSLRPDLVLLDIIMPRMDGLTSLKQLKKIDPNCRVVMCSSLGDQEAILRSIEWGATDFIVKPFHKHRLISAVKKAFREM